MLKPKFELDSLSWKPTSRPIQLDSLTYPEFYAQATSQCVIKCKCADDFKGYLHAKSALESAQALLADSLSVHFRFRVVLIC